MTNSGGAVPNSFASDASSAGRWRRSRAPVTLGVIFWFLATVLVGSLAEAATGAQTGAPEGAWLESERNTMEVVRAVGASVVSVRIANDGQSIPGRTSNGQEFQGGSGFVVDEDGRIITNFHVVAMLLADGSDESLELSPGASLHVSYVGAPDEEYEARVAAAQLPDRPRLGLEIARQVDDYPSTLRERLELPDQGVVVTAVAEGGPADEAGIQGPQGVILIQAEPFPFGMDVITRINGEEVRQPLDIQRVILEHDEGDVVTLTVWRDGTELEVEIALEVVPVK